MTDNQERAPLLSQPVSRLARHERELHKKRETYLRAVAVVFLVTAVSFLLIQHYREQKAKIEVCYSRDCVRTAGEILNDIDESVNPCTDFWSFSCGGYVKNNPITGDEGYDVTFYDVGRKTALALRELLESDFDGVSTVSLTNDDQKFDRRSWGKFQDYYDACLSLNEEGRDSPTLALLARSVTKHFSPPSRRGRQNKLNRTDFTIALGELARYSIFPFVSARPGPSWSQYTAGDYELNVLPTIPWSWIGAWDSPSPYFSSKALQVQASREIYQKVISQTIGGAFSRLDPEYYPNKTLDDIIEDVLQFEEKWISVSTAERNPSDPPTNQTIPLDDLDEVFSNVEWPVFFDTVAPQNTKLPFNTTAYWPKTLRKVDKLIDDANPQTLMFVLLWRGIFQAWFSNLPRWQAYKSEINQATGVSSRIDNQPHWKKCLSESMAVMPAVAGRTFIYDVLDPNAKKNVDQYVKEITDAYVERFRDVKWVNSSDDRDALIEKVEAMRWETVAIGYEYNLTSAKDVAASVKNLPVSNSYVLNTLDYAQYTLDKAWGKLGDPYEIAGWKEAPAWMVNAFNEVWLNQVVIPGGIVQKPWYSDSNPDYINFGAIGTVLGHEAGHGFDEVFIARYDKDGNHTNWISDNVVAEVKRRARCIVDQKDLYKNPEEYINQVVCDQAGIRQSFSAWTKRRDGGKSFAKNNRLLPGLDLTREQLFYVSYGRTFCANLRSYWSKKIVYSAVNPLIAAIMTEALENMRGSDAAPPPFFSPRPHDDVRISALNTTKEIDPYLTYRVNVGVRNVPGFAEAFNCPVGSPMNPEQKCEIW